MNEHGWPGWPDDPTGGLHDGHDSGLHDGGPHATPDDGWTAGDRWDDYDESSAGADHHDGADDREEVGTDITDHPTTGYDNGADHDAGDPAAPGSDPTMGPVGADPDADTDTGVDPAEPFPPAVDVGALPEPIDGFPWIDTGSLGLVGTDAGAELAPPEQLSADLAAYAVTDLPPGVDPWAQLATSDDPATSALARWWAPER